MKRTSGIAIEIINNLHTELLDYNNEYIPLINCANQCAAYEDTGFEPEEIPTGLELANVFAALEKLKQYEAIGTVEHLADLQARFDMVNDFLESQAAKLLEKNGKLQKALCVLCRDIAKRDGNLLGCYSCHFKPSGFADVKVPQDG